MCKRKTKGSSTPIGLPGGGGDTQQMFIRGGSARRFNPLYTIFHEKGTPFVYLLLTNGTPFTNLV